MTSLLLSVALLWGIAVVTPGPNFLITAQTALGSGRMAAFCAVLGLITGTALWGVFGILGIAILFQAAPWLFLTLKLLGGMYLIWLGWTLLRGALIATPSAHPSSNARGASPMQAYGRGLITILANPKSGAFVASMMSAVLPQHPTIGQGLAIVAVMMAISGFWYGAVAYGLGFDTPRRLYVRGKRLIEGVAGVLFAGFGVKLILDKS